MTQIQFNNGVILFEGSTVALNPDCCCDCEFILNTLTCQICWNCPNGVTVEVSSNLCGIISNALTGCINWRLADTFYLKKNGIIIDTISVGNCEGCTTQSHVCWSCADENHVVQDSDTVSVQVSGVVINPFPSPPCGTAPECLLPTDGADWWNQTIVMRRCQQFIWSACDLYCTHTDGTKFYRLRAIRVRFFAPVSTGGCTHSYRLSVEASVVLTLRSSGSGLTCSTAATGPGYSDTIVANDLDAACNTLGYGAIRKEFTATVAGTEKYVYDPVVCGNLCSNPLECLPACSVSLYETTPFLCYQECSSLYDFTGMSVVVT